LQKTWDTWRGQTEWTERSAARIDMKINDIILMMDVSEVSAKAVDK